MTELAEQWATRIGPAGTRATAPAYARAVASDAAGRRKFLVHGAAIEIENSVSSLAGHVDWALRPFALPADRIWPDGVVPLSGSLQPYDLQSVFRHLSPVARRLPEGQMTTSHDGQTLEIYEDGERFWLVDERWGMAEVNLLRGQWRSWVLPEQKVDPVRRTEMAVLWPLAQLLRGRGLNLVPAVSAVRDGWAVLLVGPAGLEPELAAMIRAGYRLIGQRWTALREEEGRLALLHLPGRVQCNAGPRLAGPTACANTGGSGDAWQSDAGWVDLTVQHHGSRQLHAFCDAVLILSPGRRPRAEVRDLAPSEALLLLRRAWPIAELHPTRRAGRLAGKLARHCRCAEAQLSRDPRDLLGLLDMLHAGTAAVPPGSELPEIEDEEPFGDFRLAPPTSAAA